MKMPLYYIFLLLVMLFVSCNKKSETNNNSEYIDLSSFVDAYKSNFPDKRRVEKMVMVNDAEEIKQIEDYNLELELDMLTKYNINKASYSGKYLIEKSGDTTIYRANEPQLTTRKIEAIAGGDVLKWIKIEGMRKSILSESKQTIIFEPEKSYHLISEDNNRYGENLKKEILIKF